jgi:hypothetical protein
MDDIFDEMDTEYVGITISDDTFHVIPITKIQYTCFSCLKQSSIKLFMCSGCGFNRYCDVNCQRIHWKAMHKEFCEMMKVNPTTQVLIKRDKSTN